MCRSKRAASRSRELQRSDITIPVDLQSDLTDLTASQLSQVIRERRVSCVEVMTAYLTRIDRLNPSYTAI